MECGTTALGAFIIRNRLTVFSIGDCQAVLCSGGLAVSRGESDLSFAKVVFIDMCAHVLRLK